MGSGYFGRVDVRAVRGSGFAVRGSGAGAEPQVGLPRPSAAAAAELPPAPRRSGGGGSGVMGTKYEINWIPPPPTPPIVINDVL